MSYIKKKISGLKKRYKLAQYGIFYFRDANLIMQEKLRINGKSNKFNFTDTSNAELAYEFNEICINDCYHLTELKKNLSNVRVIVDIGANQGLFAIAARQLFAHASITCYEPNQMLEPVLSQNAGLLHAKVFYEAVCQTDCKLTLKLGKSDLHTQIQHSPNGHITGTSFSKLVQRAGGRIDILKMDCEGAEWELFEESSTWEKIRSVTLEYHLWANKNKSAEDVIAILQNFGFTLISDKRLTVEFGLMTAVRLS
jgi:FkbM family methyltransferase